MKAAIQGPVTDLALNQSGVSRNGQITGSTVIDARLGFWLGAGVLPLDVQPYEFELDPWQPADPVTRMALLKSSLS
jgi:hypothetical protein